MEATGILELDSSVADLATKVMRRVLDVDPVFFGGREVMHTAVAVQ